jgi:outer membrane lipoprotein-sorting protein
MFFKVIFLFLLALSLSACATAEPVSVSTAQTTLVSTWHADGHIVWEIEWLAAPVGGPLTVEMWRAGPRYRFEILEATAPDLIGQTLIFDGQRAWRYNRFDVSRNFSQSGEAQLSPVTDALMMINRLEAATPETATQEPVHLWPGPAQKITLTLPGGETLTLWRDEATGLPVRLEFVAGGQTATLRARSFEPLPDPAEGLFRP